MLRHFVNILLMCFPPSRLFKIRSFLLSISGVKVSTNVKYCGHGWVYGRGNLLIGKDTWLSPGVIFYTHENADIIIGDRCDIGPDVKFIIGTHDFGSAHRRAGVGVASSITIGSGCWIGAGAMILDGVSVGEGCVIAAGAVVTKDVPNEVLSAGVPAIVKRSLI